VSAPNGWVCITENMSYFGIGAIFTTYSSTANSVTFNASTSSGPLGTQQSYQCTPY
jgi:hypothetical protein